jgi:ferredoxin
MKTFYFTATGNSLNVANVIGGELLSIPQILKHGPFEFEDEKIGFIIPCYYFGIPNLIYDFFDKVNFKSEYYFGILTFGGMSGAALNRLIKLGKEKGIKFNYTNEICMIDNYLPMYEISKELKKKENSNFEEVIEKVSKEIKENKNSLLIKNQFTNIFSNIAYGFYKRALGKSDFKFSIDKNCNGCKICEKVCPVDNIEVFDKPKFNHKCEICLSCIHNCPKKSIHHKKEKSENRHRNRNVTVKEIISSNL